MPHSGDIIEFHFTKGCKRHFFEKYVWIHNLILIWRMIGPPLEFLSRIDIIDMTVQWKNWNSRQLPVLIFSQSKSVVFQLILMVWTFCRPTDFTGDTRKTLFLISKYNSISTFNIHRLEAWLFIFITTNFKNLVRGVLFSNSILKTTSNILRKSERLTETSI